MNKIQFSSSEREFLINNEACRIATCNNDIPHVVPVSYIFQGDAFYFATDYGTKKLANIKANGNVALTVDVYSKFGNKAICILGGTKIVESGPEFARLYDTFYQKFEWVRENPWKAGEAPFIAVIPSQKVSWGIDQE